VLDPFSRETVADKANQITGDDTPALQAVLDADVWRKHLLAEQEVHLMQR